MPCEHPPPCPSPSRGEGTLWHRLRETDCSVSLFQLRLAPGERGFQSILVLDLIELLADFGGGRIERRQHVKTGIKRIAKTGRVKTAIDRELGGGQRFR